MRANLWWGALILAGTVAGATTDARADMPAPPPDPAPADPTAAPAMTPPAPMMVAPPVAPPTTVDRGTLDDANAGQTWLSPTALTPPAGTWSFSDYELFLVGLSYAVTDQLVISATTMVPVTGSLEWGFVSAKLQIVKEGRLRLALQGGLLGLVAGGSSSSDSTGGGDVGGALTYCFDDDCYSHASAFVGAAFAYQSQASLPVGFSGSVVARLGRRLRLVVEADSGHSFGDISGQADGILAWYGLRFTSRQIGVDVGLVKPICSDCSSDTFPAGFPVVSFTYRGLD